MDTSKVLKSGEYSDLTICCGSHEFRVHRVIVCTQSRFFAAACNGEFQEAKSGKISLVEDDPRAVERMLSYLYTRDYSDPSCPGILANLRVYTLADKYEMDGLKDFAAKKFLERAIDGWSSDEFLEMLMEVFDPTQRDHGLQYAVTRICRKKIQGLVAKEAFMTTLMDIPRLAVGLVEKLEAKTSKQAVTISALRDMRCGEDRELVFRHCHCCSKLQKKLAV